MIKVFENTASAIEFCRKNCIVILDNGTLCQKSGAGDDSVIGRREGLTFFLSDFFENERAALKLTFLNPRTAQIFTLTAEQVNIDRDIMRHVHENQNILLKIELV